LNLLIISSACILGVNRTPYKILAGFDKINLTLLIPYRKSEVNTHNGISDIENSGFPIILSEIIGIHPRLERINNLKQVIETVRPDTILLEFDVATMMMYETIKFSRKFNSKISFIALENFKRNFLWESLKAAVQLKITKIVGALFTFYLYMNNASKIDIVFCVSDDSIEAMKYLGFSENKIIKIPLGIDTDLFFPFDDEKVKALREKQNLSKVTVAYFGRIIPEKGVDNLITALNSIKGIEWELLLDNFNTYKSDYLNKLNNLIIKYSFQDRIRYFDAKHSEMPNFINCADIVVLPSKSNSKFKEQYGRVAAESLCCGKIVLVSNSGALPELVGDTGFIFKKDDIKDLSERLKYLIENYIAIKKSLFSKIVDRGKNNLSAKTQASIIYNNL